LTTRATWILGLVFVFPSLTQANPPPDPHYCHGLLPCSYDIAQGFSPWETLTQKQSDLLREYLPELQNAVDPSVAYQAWAAENDGLAATYLALTQAMAAMTITLDQGEQRPLIDIVVRINQLEGDRVRFALDAGDFDRWKKAGAKFSWKKANGKTETGHFNFDSGDLGGSLHAGYDQQGYTSYYKVPRLQINYRLSDSDADIDLDGYAPWIWGFIPDPVHLTYANSDVRQWLSEYIKKMGNPGFSVNKIDLPAR
jgi:hypothetical protein